MFTYFANLKHNLGKTFIRLSFSFHFQKNYKLQNRWVILPTFFQEVPELTQIFNARSPHCNKVRK